MMQRYIILDGGGFHGRRMAVTYEPDCLQMPFIADEDRERVKSVEELNATPIEELQVGPRISFERYLPTGSRAEGARIYRVTNSA